MIGSDLDRALCPPIYSSPSQPPSIVRAATGLPVLHSSPRRWNPRLVRIHLIAIAPYAAFIDGKTFVFEFCHFVTGVCISVWS